MKVLFYDLETAGLPEKGAKDPVHHPERYPYIIEIAWSIIDKDTKEVFKERTILIKPDENWEMPSVEKLMREGKDLKSATSGAAFWTDHGFTQEKSLKEGLPMLEALTEFTEDIAACDYLVAYNLGFDFPVTVANIVRYKVPKVERKDGSTIKRFCAMMPAVNYIKSDYSPDFYKKYAWARKSRMLREQDPDKNPFWKYPRLEESHEKLFSCKFDDAHSAFADIQAMIRVTFELIERGVYDFDKNPWTLM